jgi:hypothetical protein
MERTETVTSTTDRLNDGTMDTQHHISSSDGKGRNVMLGVHILRDLLQRAKEAVSV